MAPRSTWAVGRRDLWLVQVGTESRCDPSQDRACSAQASRLRHMSSQAPWPGALGGTVPDGVEWQFPHQRWLSSIPSLSACLGPATPGKRREDRAQPEQLVDQGGGTHLAGPAPPWAWGRHTLHLCPQATPPSPSHRTQPVPGGHLVQPSAHTEREIKAQSRQGPCPKTAKEW